MSHHWASDTELAQAVSSVAWPDPVLRQSIDHLAGQAPVVIHDGLDMLLLISLGNTSNCGRQQIFPDSDGIPNDFFYDAGRGQVYVRVCCLSVLRIH